VKVTNIPEEISSWQSIKDTFKEKIPKGKKIRFVSKIGANSECYIWFERFDGDSQFLKELQVDLEGNLLTIKLVDHNDYKLFQKELPAKLKNFRDKEINTLQKELATKPLLLANTSFKNLDYMKKCVWELLDKTDAGKELEKESNGETVIKAIFEYHPKACFKLNKGECLQGIKVDLHEKVDAKTGKRSKCFFFNQKNKNTEEITYEDFSISKCFSEIAKNPPLDNSIEDKEKLTVF